DQLRRRDQSIEISTGVVWTRAVLRNTPVHDLVVERNDHAEQIEDESIRSHIALAMNARARTLTGSVTRGRSSGATRRRRAPGPPPRAGRRIGPPSRLQ